MSDTFTTYDASALPAHVVAYLDAHDARRLADAVAVFAPDAGVLDDGKTYDGVDAIAAWIEHSSTEYRYTSTRIGQSIPDEGHTVVQIRLDGNFPGGTVTLRYQFEHTDRQITHLAIEV